MIKIRADASHGYGWIVEGWQLFAKAPEAWIAISLIYLAINVVLSLIPLVSMIRLATQSHAGWRRVI